MSTFQGENTGTWNVIYLAWGSVRDCLAGRDKNAGLIGLTGGVSPGSSSHSVCGSVWARGNTLTCLVWRCKAIWLPVLPKTWLSSRFSLLWENEKAQIKRFFKDNRNPVLDSHPVYFTTSPVRVFSLSPVSFEWSSSAQNHLVNAQT